MGAAATFLPQPRPDLTAEFLRAFVYVDGSENLSKCLQCGSCGASCPTACQWPLSSAWRGPRCERSRSDQPAQSTPLLRSILTSSTSHYGTQSPARAEL